MEPAAAGELISELHLADQEPEEFASVVPLTEAVTQPDQVPSPKSVIPPVPRPAVKRTKQGKSANSKSSLSAAAVEAAPEVNTDHFVGRSFQGAGCPCEKNGRDERQRSRRRTGVGLAEESSTSGRIVEF